MLTFTKAAGILLMPPGIVVVLTLVGLLLWRRSHYAGTALIGIGAGALLVLSLPVTGIALLGRLEDGVTVLPIVDASLRARAEAIVVLGGGRDIDAPEYGGDTVNAATLERLRYAARLQRATGLPLLVSGGSVFGEAVPEAELMRRALLEDFQIRPAWVEARSRTTYENALYARAILEAAGITRVLLVTHAWHMPRAVWAFHQAGLEVLMAPTSFSSAYASRTVLDWLPTARGLFLSSRALHEQIGLVWYRWRQRLREAVDRAAFRRTLPAVAGG